MDQAGTGAVRETIPTWGHVVRIWWAWWWRNLIAIVLAGVLGGVVGGVLGAMLGAVGVPLGTIRIVSGIVGVLIGLGVSILPVRWIIGKRSDCTAIARMDCRR